MMERARDQIRRLGRRADVLGDCPVCGEKVKPRHSPVKAWSGRYAHRKCASYTRRPQGARGASQRLHDRFTTP